jgi:hypothetical protein
MHSDLHKKYGHHGGPWDRGAADSYYRRPRNPHKYHRGNEHLGTAKLTDPEEIRAYHAGFDENERDGNHKDWR